MRAPMRYVLRIGAILLMVVGAIWILLNHFCRLAFVALPARLRLERVQRDVTRGHQ